MSRAAVLSKLDEIDPDKAIVVKNLSKDAEEETVENFIEVITKDEIEFLHFYGNVRSIAVVKLMGHDRDIGEIQRRAATRSLSGQTVDVEELGHVCGILVSDFNKESLESNDIWELYFEREKIGGEEGCVSKFKVYKNLCLTIVKIKNPITVVPRILCHEHILQGKKVKVQPYYSNFHDAVIKELSEYHTEHCTKTDDDKEIVDDNHYTVEQKTELWKQMDDTVKPGKTTERPVRDHIYDEIHFDDEDEEEDDRYFKKSYPPIKPDSPSLKPSHKETRSSPIHEVKSEILYSRTSPSVRVQGSSPSPSRPSAGKLQILVCDSSSASDLTSLSNEQLISGDCYTQEEKSSYTQPTFSLQYDDDNDIDDEENDSDADDDDDDDRDKGLHSRNLQDNSPPKAMNLTKEEKQCSQKIQLSKPKVLLLKMSNFNKQHPKCKVMLNALHNFVKITGNQTHVNNALDDLMKKLNYVKECHESISEEKFVVLKRMKKSSKDFIKTALQASKIKAFVSLSQDDGDPSLIASAFAKDEAQKALKEVTSLVQEREISYQEGSFNILKRDEWSELVSRLERQSKVKVKVIYGKKKVIVTGSKDDIDYAFIEIKKILDKNKNITGKPFVITGGKAQLLRYCLNDEISKLRETVGKAGGSLSCKFDDNTCTLTVRGNTDTVKDTESQIKQMLWQCWEGSVDLTRISRKEKELTALSKGLMSKKGRQLTLSFSKDNSCVITVEKGESIQLPQVSRPKRDNRHTAHRFVPFARAQSLPDIPQFEIIHRRSSSPISEDDSDEDLTPLRSPSSCTLRVNNCTITVKQGDITKERADVLVNVMSRSRKTDESVISKKFFKAGGPALQQNFQARNDGSSNVILTPGGQNLQCQHVCHVLLNRFEDSKKVKFYIRSAIAEVFQAASNQGATSVSFPAVGTGRLLQFPVAYSAECLVSEAIKACQEHNFQQITFVIFDMKMMHTFVKRLQQENPSGAVTTPLVQTHPRNRPVRQRYHQGISHDVSSERYSRRTTEDTSQESRETTCLVAKVLVFATCKEYGERTRRKFEEKITSWFCQKEIIKDDKIKLMSRDSKQEIYELVRGKPVEVDIRTDKGKISLLGEKEGVSEVAAAVYKILLKMTDGPKIHRAIKHQRGTVEYWRELSKEPPLPGYWESFKGRGKFSGLSDFNRKELSWNGAALYDVDDRTFIAVKSLVEVTFDPTLVGQGQDARGLAHNKIKVKKVQRIENFELYQMYANKRSSFFRSLGDGHQRPQSLAQMAPKGGITSAQKVDKHLLSDMYDEINEHYFFHGTDQSVVDNIADKGLDPRHGNDSGMFGSGIYGAECSTKADQYADANKIRQNGNRKMLLIRLILGNILVSNNPQKYKIPPCMICNTPNCKTATHRPYDSVVGDGKWLFREFVVYAREQCYPEYVITYDRS